ncbi:hypothetical protein A7982_13314 [Minicystis rosea]|nr:hypothetical protein A7982_13314 [Minicystis rosea]
MPTAMSLPAASMIALLAASLCACDAEKSPPAASSAAPPAASTPAPPAASTPASAAAPPPTASASGPVHDCPAGSSGDGSFNKPCDAKGTARMMEVTWTGKLPDEGPSFRVVNKSPSVILYGKMVAYFYDKSGKQLEVKDGAGKALPFRSCTGNLFSGVMKPAEKAVITFSCLKKEHVPEGTAAIEGEMQVVGFADSSEKKSEYYWRNTELTPDARPKGGVKK